MLKKQNNNIAPVVLFVYNRPKHVEQAILYLSQCKLASSTDLFIFSDGAKDETQAVNVEDVRKVLKNVKGFKSVTITESVVNKGLANSVISGVTKVINKYGSVIVLEDDLIVGPDFLKFMNDALFFYRDNPKIMSITGSSCIDDIPKHYSRDYYTFYRSWSHSWATWVDRWETVDWDITDFCSYRRNIFKRIAFCKCGSDVDKMLRMQMKRKIDSWAIRFCYNQFKQGKLTIFPSKSLVTNIGFDGSGTHCGVSSIYNTTAADSFSYSFSNDVSVDCTIARIIRRKFNRSIFRFIKRIFGR